MLENSALIFPKNYGTLILIELVIMICGLPAIFFIKEKEDNEDPSEPESLMTIIRKIPTIIREDTMIKMLIITQLLISFYSLATPFYSVYTLSTLGMKDTIVGYFLSAQMFGRLAFSFLWAHFCNTGRHQQIIQLTSVLYLTSLFLMLILGLVSLPEEVVTYGVIASFTLTGAAMNGMWIGSNTYIMETSKMDRRPILLGFLNSLNVLTSILTLLGGYMLGYLSYEVIFLLAIIPLSISLLIVSNLRKKII
jgi:Na+/melibiose symporter-like transporter